MDDAWRDWNETLPVMSELPSGTVTFVFTDLESSTRLWEDGAAL